MLTRIVFIFLLSLAASVTAGEADTSLNTNVDKKTKEVKFTAGNNDSQIVTKVYKLKHADPYEILPFLRKAVGASRIKGARTKVEAIKYNDGTGAVIVSAEAYRFGKHKNGTGISEIVKQLDLPHLEHADDEEFMVYYPKYRSASSLARTLRKVGASNGIDKITVDRKANIMIIKGPVYTHKTIKEMLRQYDAGPTQVYLNFKFYEIRQESKAQMEAAYKSWKEGPGKTYFTVSMIPASGSKTKTTFLNFKPEWKTAYFDYLVTKKDAKVVFSGNILASNRQKSFIETDKKETGNKKESMELKLSVIPTISSDSSQLDINISGMVPVKRKSTITSEHCYISTKIQLGNFDNEIVIGGSEIVSTLGSRKQSWFGRMFSSESSKSDKLARLVVVISCRKTSGPPPLEGKQLEKIKKIETELNKSSRF